MIDSAKARVTCSQSTDTDHDSDTGLTGGLINMSARPAMTRHPTRLDPSDPILPDPSDPTRVPDTALAACPRR